MSQLSERRRFHRFPFDAQGQLLTGDSGRVPCELLDLSINGALVRLEDRIDLDPGRSGELKLVLRGHVRGDQVEMRMNIETVRVDGRVAGFRFVAVDTNSFDHLRNFIEDNLGDISLLDRELTNLDYWPGIESGPDLN